MVSYVRATHKNTVFHDIEEQWRGQLAAYGEVLEEYAVPHMEHAKKIAKEKPLHRSSGIFALNDDDGVYQAIFHANSAALPKTTGRTLRLNWMLLSPRFEFEDMAEADLARLMSGLIVSAIGISEEVFKSNHVKVRLRNTQERIFAHGVATNFRSSDSNISVAVRGFWLHIDNLNP